MSMDRRLHAIFEAVFGPGVSELSDQDSPATIKRWDSLNHVTLVMTLEEQFAVKFTTREVMGWRNVGQMLDCLEAKLNK